MRSLAPFVVAALLLTASSLVAGPWRPLFNGKDLAGWKVLNGTATYAVVDGAIVGSTVTGSPNTFLVTEEVFGDFIFECEVLQEGGHANGGIQFRSLSIAEQNNGRVHGYQCEIDPGARAWTGGIYDEARRGWMYPGTLNPRAQSAYQYGRWNHFRIEAIGPSLRTWVNGIPVAHVIDAETARGFFALQVHSVSGNAGGRRTSWRNIRVQTTELTPAPADDIFIRNFIPNQLGEAERALGWRLLWDGQSMKGWRPAGPAAGWKIVDGALVTGGAAGDLVSEESFGEFEFELEFKLSRGADSGVGYFVADLAGEAGAGPRPLGLEYQLIDDQANPAARAGVAGNNLMGALAGMIPAERMPAGAAIAPRVGVWDHVRIVARADKTVEHWLNGIKIVEYRHGSPLFRALVAHSSFAKVAGFGNASQGPILLQNTGTEVAFRSIKVRVKERSPGE